MTEKRLTFGDLDGTHTPPPVGTVTYTGQLYRVWKLMKDTEWRTLERICAVTGGTETAISARLRDLKKPEFGDHEMNKRALASRPGIYEYRIIPNPNIEVAEH